MGPHKKIRVLGISHCISVNRPVDLEARASNPLLNNASMTMFILCVCPLCAEQCALRIHAQKSLWPRKKFALCVRTDTHVEMARHQPLPRAQVTEAKTGLSSYRDFSQ